MARKHATTADDPTQRSIELGDAELSFVVRTRDPRDSAEVSGSEKNP
ncbi:MAG: hypothetical protein V3V08_17630 [Nannocystaceae bacterium]